MIVFSLNCFSQDTIAIHNESKCINQNYSVTTTLNGIFLGWYPDITFPNDSKTINSYFTKQKNLTARSVIIGENLVVNGDFEKGNTGFKSALKFKNPNDAISVGEYKIDSKSLTCYNCIPSSPYKGNYLLSKGLVSATTNLWQQQVAVKPNTNYVFSAWINYSFLYTYSNTYNIQFTVNGKIVDSPKYVNSMQGGTWAQYYVEWNSGSDVSANLSIKEMLDAFNYYDIALDDISFASEEKMQYEIFNINPVKAPLPQRGYYVCENNNSPVLIDAGANCDSYSWNTGEQTQKIKATAPNDYGVKVVKDGCFFTEYITVQKQNCTQGTPFKCNKKFYYSAGDTETQLYVVDPKSETDLTFVELGPKAITYNGFGYNRVDNYIYAMRSFDNHIMRISSDVSTYDIGHSGLPKPKGENDFYYAVDCDSAGNFIVAYTTGSKFLLYTIDVLHGLPKILDSISITSTAMVADIACHPTNGKIYSIDNTTMQPIVIDRVAGTIQNCGSSLLLTPNSITGANALFFDSYGKLYGFDPNKKALGEIDINTGESHVLSSNGNILNFADGCSCPYSIEMQKTTDSKTYNSGDTITYTFTIQNSTNSNLNKGLFSDTINAKLKIIEILNQKSGTIRKGTGVGTNMLVVDDFIVPKGKTTFSVKVVSSCKYNYISAIGNQAKLYNLPQSIGVVLSDDPSTVQMTDSTFVTITSKPPIDIKISKSDFICVGESVTLEINPSIVNCYWEGPNNFSAKGPKQTIAIKSELQKGVYTVQSDKSECASNGAILINVLKSENFHLGNDTVFCQGGKVTYTIPINSVDNKWNIGNIGKSITISSSGKYIAYANYSTCVSSDTVTVTVNPLPTIDIEYNKKEICIGESLLLNAKGIVASYQWNEGVQNNIAFNPISTKTYRVSAVDFNGCKNAYSITIPVHQLPKVIAQSSEINICMGKSISLQAIGAQKYEWDNNAKTNESIHPTISTTYHVTGTDEFGCKNTSSVFVKVFKANIKVQPHISTTALCDGDIIYFWGTGIKTYKWNNHIVDSSKYIIKHSGCYTVTGYDAQSCIDVDSICVTIKPLPQSPVASSDTICYYQEYPTLSALGNDITWVNDATNVIDNFGNTFTPKTLELGENKWLVYENNDGCKSIPVTSLIFVVPPSNIKIKTSDTTLCEHPKHMSYYKVDGPHNLFEWKLPVGIPWDFASNDSTIIGVSWDSQGVDTIQLVSTDKFGCINKTSQIVSIAPYPVADFSYIQHDASMSITYHNLADTSVINEVNRPLMNTYFWNYDKSNDSLVNRDASDNTIKYKYGYHDVMFIVRNEFNCVDTMIKTVFVDVFCSLYFPNAFEPENPSAELRLFRAKGLCLKTYEMTIYDFWGNTLWHTDKLMDGQPYEGWNGTYNGVPLKCDTYVWKVEATFEDGTVWKGNPIGLGRYSKFGNVLLLR